MNNKVIINVAVGGWYPKGQDRLKKSLYTYSDGSIDFMGWDNQLPEGAVPHSQNKYNFKTWAFLKAINAGYRYILWLDCAYYFIKPAKILFDEIERTGYILTGSGNVVGNWCADAALTPLGITRDEAFTIKEVASGCAGFDMNRAASQLVIDDWHKHSKLGTFHYSHSNKNHEVSSRDDVYGHRHDQTALSVIARNYGLTKIHDYPMLADYASNTHRINETTVILNQGM